MGLLSENGLDGVKRQLFEKNAILPIVFLLVSQLGLDELAVQTGDVGD